MLIQIPIPASAERGWGLASPKVVLRKYLCPDQPYAFYVLLLGRTPSLWDLGPQLSVILLEWYCLGARTSNVLGRNHCVYPLIGSRPVS